MSFYTEAVKKFNENDYESAKSLFFKAIKEEPIIPDSYLYLGKCYFFCNEKHQAIQSLKEFIKLRPNNIDKANAYDLLGQCYEAENDAEAELSYSTAILSNQSCTSAWNNLGLLKIKCALADLTDLTKSHKLFMEALDCIKTALKFCSDNPMFLHSAASWYEKYIDVLNEVLERALDDEIATQNNITSNFKMAIQYYRNALSKCKEDDVALKNIIQDNLIECLAQYGHNFYTNENYKEALEIYLEVLLLDPVHLIVINQIGMSFFKQNNFSEARIYFSSILEKTEDQQEIADAWLNISCCYRLEKELEKARHSLNQAKINAPNDPAIAEEEKNLIELESAATLISSPQSLFGNSNSTSQVIENKEVRGVIESTPQLS